MSSQSTQNSDFTPLSQISEEEFLPYQESGGADPPAYLDMQDLDINFAPCEQPLTAKELARMDYLDDLVIRSFIDAGEKQNINNDIIPDRSTEWGKWALEVTGIIEQEDSGQELTAREIYYSIIKKHRIILSALFYNQVVKTCMATGGGVGKINDEEFAKQYAFQRQEEYLSYPIWMTSANFDKHEEINPFLILEGDRFN